MPNQGESPNLTSLDTELGDILSILRAQEVRLQNLILVEDKPDALTHELELQLYGSPRPHARELYSLLRRVTCLVAENKQVLARTALLKREALVNPVTEASAENLRRTLQSLDRSRASLPSAVVSHGPSPFARFVEWVSNGLRSHPVHVKAQVPAE